MTRETSVGEILLLKELLVIITGQNSDGTELLP